MALTLVVAGCSEDPIEQYLDRVRQITVTMQRDSISALPDPEAITRQGISGVNDARRAALTALVDLPHPTEFDPEHSTLVAGLSDLVAAGDMFLAETEGLDGAEFVDRVLASTTIDAIAGRVAAACLAIDSRAEFLDYAAALAC